MPAAMLVARMSMNSEEVVEDHTAQTGRTLLELHEREDGTWRATQTDVEVEGTGETAALAAMDYCRKIAEWSADERR